MPLFITTNGLAVITTCASCRHAGRDGEQLRCQLLPSRPVIQPMNWCIDWTLNMKRKLQEPDQPVATGEGITRCGDPNAPAFWVDVWYRNQKPMACYVRAWTPQQAIQFCRARHPDAVMVELMEGQ